MLLIHRVRLRRILHHLLRLGSFLINTIHPLQTNQTRLDQPHRHLSTATRRHHLACKLKTVAKDSWPPDVSRLMEEFPMRKIVLSTMLAALCAVQIGCVVPIYSSSADTRIRQLIYVSEGYRHIPQIWERVWGLELPDLATPYRTHGGVI